MKDAWVVWLALASLVLVVLGLLAAAWTRRRLGLAAAALFVLAVAAWVADLVAISSGYRDADGFADCADNCRPMHRLTALGFVAPPLVISLSAAGMLVALLVRSRARRALGENRH